MIDMRCRLLFLLALLAILLVATLVDTSAVRAQEGNPRIALVIGNDSYQKVSALRNARADARAMAQSLERAGFRVTLRVDANERAMKEAIRTFKAQLSGGAEAVFFFAGHGVQLGGANYLLPTDIGSESEDQVKDDALSLQRVLNDMQEQKARFSMAIIDACRNNPFRSAGRAIGGRGLAPTTAASGQIVLYSAGTGQEALDRLGNNDTNPNGLFTRVFLREMEKPGVPVDQVLRNVREQVVKLAKGVGHDQVPALYDQAIGRFYFHASTGATQTAALNPEPRQTTDPLQVEMMFWDSIKGSTAREDFEEYKSRFPNGQFVGLADNRIRALTPPVNKPLPPVQVALAPSTTQTFVSATRPAASNWSPRGPVSVIVPWAPGGASDLFARLLAAEMSGALGQKVVIDNRLGAGGAFGAELASKASADGHTLLFTMAQFFTVIAHTYSRPPVSESDFSMIAQFGSQPLALVAPVSTGNLRDLIAQRGSYGSSGVGSVSHVMMELFKSVTRASWAHVPYKGVAPAMADLMGGQLNAMISIVAALAPHVSAGRLRAHGVSGATRVSALPDVPTFAEQGIKLEQTQWYVLAAPRGMARDAVARYHHEVSSALRKAAVQQRVGSFGATLNDLSPRDVTDLIRAESAVLGNVIRSAGIRVD